MTPTRSFPVAPQCVPHVFGATLLAFVLSAGSLRAQYVSSPASPADAPAPSGGASTLPAEPNSPAGVEGLHPGGIPANAFSDNPNGIPYSGVLTPTAADFHSFNALQGHQFQTDYASPANLGTAEGGFDIDTGNVNLTHGFIKPGTEPENANIKAGPFYIQFHSLDGLVLYDDNFRATQTDRKSELLVLLQLNLTVIAQLSDDLQFAVSGSIAYLPLQNQVGIEANDYGDLGLLLFAAPLFAAQMVYDVDIAGWPVRLADDFRVGAGSYSDSTQNNFDLFNGDTLQRDENGRYTFRSGQTGLRNGGDNVSNQDNSVLYMANTVSALTDRLLPGDARLTISLSHENLWYNQNNRGLPPGRDDFTAYIVSERANLRFKPYAGYEATYIEGTPGVTQVVTAGFSGPIDDRLFLNANAGYYVQENHQSYLYGLTLNHNAGPFTTESLSLNRSLTSFDQEQNTSEYYRLNQILGPTLVGTLFLAQDSYDELTGDGAASHSEYLGGIQFGWELGPKTNLVLAGIYEHQKYHGGLQTDTMTGRLVLNRTVTDTLTIQLLYEYQRYSSSNPYYENLIYLRVTKLLE